MKEIIVYVHGKGGNAEEAEHYRALFPGREVIGFDYRAQCPWEAREEFPRFFEQVRKRFDGSLTLIANSIGAFYSMSALTVEHVDTAMFISPIVDMERLITDMMQWASVTEEELQAQGEIPTAFGETLSWEYLCYVRRHPPVWEVPTRILYGEHDALTSPATMSAFAKSIGAPLTVMPGGEHWFHTSEQMRYLDGWIQDNRAPR